MSNCLSRGMGPHQLHARVDPAAPILSSCLSVQYLNWTKNRSTRNLWCRYPSRTREHLFRVYTEWKAQQKILWAEGRKETGRWKDRWKVRDLMADERCGRAVMDFLSTTDVGRRVPAEEDAVGEVSEAEVWEWLEDQVAGAAGRSPHRNRAAAQERPRTWRTDREDSACQGAGNPRCGATAGGGS